MAQWVERMTKSIGLLPAVLASLTVGAAIIIEFTPSKSSVEGLSLGLALLVSLSLLVGHLVSIPTTRIREYALGMTGYWLLSFVLYLFMPVDPGDSLLAAIPLANSLAAAYVLGTTLLVGSARYAVRRWKPKTS